MFSLHTRRRGPAGLLLVLSLYALYALSPAALSQERPAGGRRTLAPAARSPQLVVAKAQVDGPGNVVTIVGRDFGDGRPSVTLQGTPLEVTGYSPESVIAKLPPGVTPGAYLLTVSKGAGARDAGSIDLTIGAASAGGSQDRKSRGASCGAASECALGLFCVDGFCCDRACVGACESCGISGRQGTCEAVANMTDPDNECPNDASACRAGYCNGARACQVSAAGTVCAPASCTDNVSNRPDTCTASGVCADAGTQDCSPYKCGADTGVCPTSCSDDSACVNNYKCSDGKCVRSSPSPVRPPPRPPSPTRLPPRPPS